MDDESKVCPTCKGKCCRDTDPRDAMLASLRQELHNMNRAIADYLTERDRLRQAIRHLAVGPHAQWCTTRAECPCDCGAAQEFDWRETARKLVGLGEDEP